MVQFWHVQVLRGMKNSKNFCLAFRRALGIEMSIRVQGQEKEQPLLEFSLYIYTCGLESSLRQPSHSCCRDVCQVLPDVGPPDEPYNMARRGPKSR